jgi:DNA end-binding protein Ku
MAATPSYFLTWGAITVPVKSTVAARDERVDLVNLHAPCLARAHQKTSCSACGKEMLRAETVKGYETAKGQYVTITQDELAALEAERSKAMEIRAFVPWASIDPIYLGRSNYLGPVDKFAAKAFQLLRGAMEEAGLAAIVQYVGSGHEKLGIVRVVADALMLHESFYQAEIREYEDRSDTAPVTFTEQERKLARELIASQRSDAFDISGYSDGYQARLKELIEAKVLGQAPAKIEPVKKAAPVIDLVAALQQSLDQAKAEKPRRARRPKKDVA